MAKENPKTFWQQLEIGGWIALGLIPAVPSGYHAYRSFKERGLTGKLQAAVAGLAEIGTTYLAYTAIHDNRSEKVVLLTGVALFRVFAAFWFQDELAHSSTA